MYHANCRICGCSVYTEKHVWRPACDTCSPKKKLLKLAKKRQKDKDRKDKQDRKVIKLLLSRSKRFGLVSVRRKFKKISVNQCSICGGKFDWCNLDLHHILPMSKGGANNLANLSLLCKDCHSKQHPKLSKKLFRWVV